MTSERMSPGGPPHQGLPISPAPLRPVRTRFLRHPPGSPAGAPANVPRGLYGPGGPGDPDGTPTNNSKTGVSLLTLLYLSVLHAHEERFS